MSGLRRLGLRTRLAIALGAVALVSIGLATLLANWGLESRLSDFARDRLAASARHSAEFAVGYYGRDRGWSRQGLANLTHLAEMNGYRLAIYGRDGKLLSNPSQAPQLGDRSKAEVRLGGELVGTVVVSPISGQVFIGEDRQLHSRLNRLHLLAGALALGVGLLAGMLLATPLARPIRRVTEVARRIEEGNLDSRVEPGGGAEIERLGHALNRVAETLQHEEDVRRGAAADIAHEVRTPLTGIISRIEAAQDGVLTNERENLAAMHAEALRLKQVVEDLEHLAEAERPGLLLQKRPFDLSELADRRATSYADFFNSKGVEFSERIEPTQALGDPERVAQIVDNLLANALRYTDAGGSVTLHVTPANGEAVIEVEDTGIGIPPGDLPHIFERFWRGEKSRSRATDGAGIGLAIVRELVRAHDGRIDVQSTPEKGSCFRVVLPGTRPEPSPL